MTKSGTYLKFPKFDETYLRDLDEFGGLLNEIGENNKEQEIEKLQERDITSSQIEAISSGYRFLSLSISTIESNGLCSKGLNPVANLDVLQNPSEPHFRK